MMRVDFLLLVLSLCTCLMGILGDEAPFPTYYLEKPIRYPININLVFIGFKGDGPFQFYLDEQKVQAAIQSAFPMHSPHSLQSNTPLNIMYHISYSVSSSNEIQKYEAYLRNALTQIGDAESNRYTADIASVESFFETRQSKESGNYTIFFVHPNKEQLVGRHSQIEYSYSLRGWGNSQSWVGSGRYIVIDMTAGPVRYGKMTGYSEGAVDYESFPRIVEFFLPAGYQGTSLQGASKIEIGAKITALAISAVQYIFATDINSEHVPTVEKLLVPVIVLRNHNEFNPFDDGINMEIVRHEVQRMALPGQTIQIISANHYIHEHSHISIALSKSLKTDTEIEFNQLGQYRPHYRPYIDSKLFAHQLREVSDILGQGLLGNNPFSGDLKSVFFNENLPPNKGGLGSKRSLGTRVLPVYVLSLARYDPLLLLDKYYQVAAYNDMVVVLQTPATHVPVPFFSENLPIFIDPRSITKSIVAGMATSLGSIVPPNTRYSSLHESARDDYLWAQGQHPFGHFTNSTTVSQIFIDGVIRNTIIAKVHNSVNNLRVSMNAVHKFAARYYLDPMDSDKDAEQHLALVARIKNGVVKFDPQFVQISKLLDAHKTTEAYTLAGTLEVGTAKFLDYTEKEIEIAENDLICCIVSHQFNAPGLDATMWACIVAALIFLFALFFRIAKKQLANT
eukprot:Phypoly_transcript_04712.p1 GENE.Phypoly_transcript_04712~~Phypoly_transcript_04712.p1  ORF type:complete len:678 (+),score=68.70 Phypoly_transcript_04712:78-2111(+)